MVNDKVKILIAEDEKITAMDFKNTLQGMGCEVTAVVSSGEELIQEIIRNTPTLILADINLKGEIDGIEAMARVQESHKVPYIYITAFKDFERVVEIYNLKPMQYILKPVESSRLKEIVTECLNKIEMQNGIKLNK